MSDLSVIFPRWTNRVPAVLVVGGSLAAVALILGGWYWGSPRYTDVGYQPQQPVPFSHRMHAGVLGMDCRYCHNTVERAARAAVPPTATCMNCHQIIKNTSPKLQVVYASWETGQPIPWVRVHLLPDYAFFDHSVHLAAGVGCVSCHGRIDQMEVVSQAEPLSMGWCLDCHRNPGPHLRPQSEITNMTWSQTGAGYEPPKDAKRQRPWDQLAAPEHCSGCHR